jgi:hypothetical protein
MGTTEEVQRVVGLVPGSDSTASVVGDIDEAKKIAVHSLVTVKQFSEAVIRGEIEQAYALCANELRTEMSLNRFAAELQKQDDEWGGKPIEYEPQRIVWVYASEMSRKRSNKDHDWPKSTPKPNKRAMLNGWWTTEKPAGARAVGRPLTFWVSEEEDGYRIAKFRPFRP